MGISIVDKRNVKRDRSTENRTRFLKRIKQTIKEQMPEILNGRNLSGYGSTGDKFKINRKTISEPTIYHGQGGSIDRTLPGNDDWVEDDQIDKPPSGGGVGRKAGRGKSEDEFIIELSRDEFLKFFFEDLELPDMLESELAKIKTQKRKNAGFQTEGSPNRLSVLRSYKQSLKRRLPLEAHYDKKIKELEDRLAEIIKVLEEEVPKMASFCGTIELNLLDEKKAIEKELEDLKHKKVQINMFEDMDLRYRSSVQQDEPIAHATMIMIMDNSGSMGVKEKTIARKFFWLLYTFLDRQYDAVQMIFISHTDEAREMEEEEFFNTREAGGTIVSSALDLAHKIIKERCHDTNIYVAQVSDGDNMDTDNGTCYEILEDDLLPKIRYMAYIQVDDYHDDHSDVSSPNMFLNFDRGLWTTYESVSGTNKKLQIKRVFEEKDIFPVFRALFKKKEAA